MYICTSCGEDKPADQFYYRRQRGSEYREGRCIPCLRAAERLNYRKRMNATPATLQGNDYKTVLRRRAWRLNFVRIRRELREGAA